MDKEEDVGKTPSVDSPSGGVKSAAGINDLENVPANNNSDDAGFPTTLRKAKKELFPDSNKRLSNKTNTPNKGGEDMVECPGDLMIFGPRSTSIRSYSSIFIDKTRLEYIHHIHRQFSLETLGDTEATLALNTAYETKKAITMREDAKILAERREKGLIDAMNFLGGEQSAFLQRIDDTFKGALENSLVRFQEYNEPIVSKEKIVEFMEEAHVMFPVVLAALCSMRGVELNEERSKHLVESKLIQVF